MLKFIEEKLSAFKPALPELPLTVGLLLSLSDL